MGSTYEYELSSTNLGNAEFTGTLVIEDTLPAALTVDSYDTIGWVCTPAAPQTGPVTIRCEFDYTTTGLAAGATTPIITFETTINATGTISNTAEVSAVDANIDDTNTGNDSITVDVTGQGAAVSADISVAKAALVGTLPSGDQQTFTLEVFNNGPLGGGGPVDSLDVVLTDSLNGLVNNLTGTGNGLESISIDAGSATGVVCSSTSNGTFSRRLTCTIDVLPQCTSGVDCPEITVVTRPGGDAGTRNNRARVVSNTTADSNPNNNTDNVSFNITARTDVTIEKSALPNPAIVGQELVYVITARNQPENAGGNSTALSEALGVIVTDTFPNDLTFVSAVPSSGMCTTEPDPDLPTSATNNQLICEIGRIGSNSTQTDTVTVLPNNETLNASNISGGTAPQIQNNVSISTTTLETDGSNNTGSVITDIDVPEFDVLVNKVDSVDPVGVNEPFAYEIEVSNLGPSAVENVVVVDNMPTTKIAFVSVSADDPNAVCTFDTSSAADAVNLTSFTLSRGVVAECAIPRIEAGEKVTVTINARGDEEGSAVLAP